MAEAAVSFWKRLRRAENGIPFGDDPKFSDLSKLSAKLFVLTVFTFPERFRFEFLDKGPTGSGSGRPFHRRDIREHEFQLSARPKQRHA